MIIDENLEDDGAVNRTHLERAGDGLILRDERGFERPVRAAWVVAVMRRYGRELDDGVTADPPTLELGDGCALGRFDFRAAVDADARSYLVLHAPGASPLAALGNGVTAALRHLAARASSV